ncbi:MAG TPA: hypothetical protein DEP66_02640 [Acidimicrobiaceae bacterium]|nr:hypothetical protein [Acidimicrobiaceae bacterium]HCB37120.1 hypothetical protein [Acidimicrobiaceae bacterium]
MPVNAVVTKVVDGDTIEVDVDGIRTLVRFIGIDSPEKTGGYRPAECFGDTATTRLGKLIPPGTAVWLEGDEQEYDRYDRLLAYVYRSADGQFMNEYMVLDGYADKMPYEPNSTYADEFAAAATAAQVGGRGLWGECGGPDKLLG